MIQRVQSIWLLVGLAVEVFMLCQCNMPIQYVTGAIALVCNIILMPLTIVTVFLYKHRRMQMKFCLLVVLFALIICVMWGSLWSMGSLQIDWKCVLPLLITIFHILAYIGIRKDEKLVRSMDRIR